MLLDHGVRDVNTETSFADLDTTTKQEGRSQPDSETTYSPEKLKSMSDDELQTKAREIVDKLVTKNPTINKVQAQKTLDDIKKEWLARRPMFNENNINDFLAAIEEGKIEGLHDDPETETGYTPKQKLDSRANLLKSFDENALEGVNTTEPFNFADRTMQAGEVYKITDPKGKHMSFTVVGHNTKDNHLITTGNQPWELIPWDTETMESIIDDADWSLEKISYPNHSQIDQLIDRLDTRAAIQEAIQEAIKTAQTDDGQDPPLPNQSSHSDLEPPAQKKAA